MYRYEATMLKGGCHIIVGGGGYPGSHKETSSLVTDPYECVGPNVPLAMSAAALIGGGLMAFGTWPMTRITTMFGIFLHLFWFYSDLRFLNLDFCSFSLYNPPKVSISICIYVVLETIKPR